MARVSDAAAGEAADGQRTIDLDAGRRAFFKATGLAAASASVLGVSALAGSKEAEAQYTGFTDVQILNFALNLEYLEAEFYSVAVSGQGLTPADTVGVGGPVAGSVSGGRKANLSGVTADYANEIANDEILHVKFLRRALGSSAIGRPNLDIGDAFTQAAVAAGVIQSGQTFDPYADNVSFLLGAYIFEDVGVTAYHGAAPFLTNKDYVRAAAGILAVEAYHAGIIRTSLFAMQIADPTLPIFSATRQISALRSQLSNPNTGVPDDQGIEPSQSTIDNGPSTFANLVPTDGDSLAFARVPSQVANIVYGAQNATKGLFFPVGLNPGNAS